MIVRDYDPMEGVPVFWSACLDCGWCSPVTKSEYSAGRADNSHLAAKLAVRADRRAPDALTPEEDPGSVGTSSWPAEPPSWLRRFGL